MSGDLIPSGQYSLVDRKRGEKLRRERSMFVENNKDYKQESLVRWIGLMKE